MSVSFSFEVENIGRLSKSMVKSPCSPQPAVGVAVAEDGRNGLDEVVFEVVLDLTDVYDWNVVCDPIVEVADDVSELPVGVDCACFELGTVDNLEAPDVWPAAVVLLLCVVDAGDGRVDVDGSMLVDSDDAEGPPEDLRRLDSAANDIDFERVCPDPELPTISDGTELGEDPAEDEGPVEDIAVPACVCVRCVDDGSVRRWDDARPLVLLPADVAMERVEVRPELTAAPDRVVRMLEIVDDPGEALDFPAAPADLLLSDDCCDLEVSADVLVEVTEGFVEARVKEGPREAPDEATTDVELWPDRVSYAEGPVPERAVESLLSVLGPFPAALTPAAETADVASCDFEETPVTVVVISPAVLLVSEIAADANAPDESWLPSAPGEVTVFSSEIVTGRAVIVVMKPLPSGR
jgi:hypothetical protein